MVKYRQIKSVHIRPKIPGYPLLVAYLLVPRLAAKMARSLCGSSSKAHSIIPEVVVIHLRIHYVYALRYTGMSDPP